MCQLAHVKEPGAHIINAAASLVSAECNADIGAEIVARCGHHVLGSIALPAEGHK